MKKLFVQFIFLFHTTFADAYFVKETSEQHVVLNDNSEWEIEVVGWLIGDTIEIQYQSDEVFVLANLSRKEKISALLKQLPNGVWIEECGKTLITLSNGTIWYHLQAEHFQEGDFVTLVKAGESTLMWDHNVKEMVVVQEVVIKPNVKDPFGTYCKIKRQPGGWVSREQALREEQSEATR